MNRHSYDITTLILGLLAILSLSACTSTSTSTTAQNTEPAFDPVTMDLPAIDTSYPPFFKELLIPSDGNLLTGFMLGANGAGPHPTVALLHGYPGNEKNLDLAQSMRRAGFNVLFFHYRGAWGSEGDYSLSTLHEDVAAALQLARGKADELRVDPSRISIVGHSMGGFAALRSGSQDKEVVCVAGLAAANLGEYANRDKAVSEGFKAYTDSLVMLNNFDGAQALAEIAQHAEQFDVRSYAPLLDGKSVLLLAGAEDVVVRPEVQARIAKAYSAVPGIALTSKVMSGDHSFSASRVALQRNVIDWLQGNCD